MKFLASKAFVMISTIVTFIVGVVAGWLLGYQPNAFSNIDTLNMTKTEYVFQIKTACGYWLLAVLITFVVLLLCLVIRKLYIGKTAEAEPNK